MIVLQASHIAKQYAGREVLTDANLVVQSGDRIALVGPNGAGKSTLLRIATQTEAPDVGEVSIGRGVRVGFVAQFVEAGECTVWEYVAEAFSALYDMESRLRQLELEMARPDVYDDERRFHELSETYDQLRRQFEELGGYAVEARIRRILDGLRFPPDSHGRPVHSLSGGQKTRLSLARLLASEPDLLVLDEPTNYLDTETIAWLEDYLAASPGALLVVSHDRYFLDRVATVVYELEGGRTTRYVGNYSAYVDQKAARSEQDLKRYAAQQKEIARLETFIQKNIARASTTKRAQSRRKMLERMERIEKPPAGTPAMALRFSCRRESGKDVLAVQDLVIAYPGKPLPGPLNLRLSRGQRVAVLGPNGVGKTSFLKALVGQLQPVSGSVQWGAHVEIGYYDQEQADLHPEKSVLAEVWDDFPGLDRTTVRTALGRFLFRGEEVDKPVAALSGGERSRVALCKLMLRQANVLVMDEPTNHLDLISKEVLEDALQEYEGTLLFVSHDRYFIDALATHVAVMGEAGLDCYIGNYTDYATRLAELARQRNSEPADRSVPAATGSEPDHAGASAGAPAKSTSARRAVRSADVRKLRERVAALEARISEIEQRQTDIATELTAAAMAQDVLRTQALQAELNQLTDEHAALLLEWEHTAAELEQLSPS